jgi:hypothetical protein
MNSNLPVITSDDEDRFFQEAASEDAGFGRILSFAKGEYSIDKTPIKNGAEFRVNYKGWIKIWINFTTSPPTQMVYRVRRGEVPPERATLGDDVQSEWEIFNGKPKDPWVMQFLMPFEDTETNEMVAFRTSSFGGRRALAELVAVCANRARHGEPAIPTVALDVAHFTTKSFGKIAKPHFVIRGWEHDDAQLACGEIDVEKIKPPRPEMNDEIPF